MYFILHKFIFSKLEKMSNIIYNIDYDEFVRQRDSLFLYYDLKILIMGHKAEGFNTYLIYLTRI